MTATLLEPPWPAGPLARRVGTRSVAFRVPEGDLARWREMPLERGVEVDRNVEWDGGRSSLYVRDPSDNSVELTEDEPWPA